MQMAATLDTFERFDQVFLKERRLASWPGLISSSSSQSMSVMFQAPNRCRLLEPEGRTCEPDLNHHCGSFETEREILRV